MLHSDKDIVPCWQYGESPLVLSEIFSPHTSIAIWQRAVKPVIADYFNNVFVLLRSGIRHVYHVEELHTALMHRLPEGTGKSAAVDDICLLAEMLTTLFNCDMVGLRLVPLSSPMCPSFHVDSIPVRLIHTYLGTGTDWLPGDVLTMTPPDHSAGRFARTNTGKCYLQEDIRSLKAFDVALLKGAAWPEQAQMAAVHRSGLSRSDDTSNIGNRVLLTLDPM